MYRKYFEEWEVKAEFNKEFISLWPSWLGTENYHKLDEVSELEWSKFNTLIRLISEKYEMLLVNTEKEEFNIIQDIESTLSPYQESMNKTPDEFSKYFIPELDCILSEEWDYTYIIWYLNKKAVEQLSPFIKKAGLYNFQN